MGKFKISVGLTIFVLLALSACSERNDRVAEVFNTETVPATDRWNGASTYRVLKTQAEVDAFNCSVEVLSANLIIGDQYGSDIRDLSRLGCLVRVNGFVQVIGTQLQDMRGLRLRVIRSGLQVQQNPHLINLQGLGQLDSLGGYLFIAQNPRMTDFRGIGPLRHLDALAVYDNDGLIGLEGLERVVDIGHDADWFVNLHLASNDALESLDGLVSLQKVRGGIWITGHPRLKSLGAVGAVERIGGSFLSKGNGALEEIQNR
jgi:hypothetical protein